MKRQPIDPSNKSVDTYIQNHNIPKALNAVMYGDEAEILNNIKRARLKLDRMEKYIKQNPEMIL